MAMLLLAGFPGLGQSVLSRADSERVSLEKKQAEGDCCICL